MQAVILAAGMGKRLKELTTKTNGRNYLRLAVKNTEDNDILIRAMKEELGAQ